MSLEEESNSFPRPVLCLPLIEALLTIRCQRPRRVGGVRRIWTPEECLYLNITLKEHPLKKTFVHKSRDNPNVLPSGWKSKKLNSCDKQRRDSQPTWPKTLMWPELPEGLDLGELQILSVCVPRPTCLSICCPLGRPALSTWGSLAAADRYYIIAQNPGKKGAVSDCFLWSSRINSCWPVLGISPIKDPTDMSGLWNPLI